MVNDLSQMNSNKLEVHKVKIEIIIVSNSINSGSIIRIGQGCEMKAITGVTWKTISNEYG